MQSQLHTAWQAFLQVVVWVRRCSALLYALLTPLPFALCCPPSPYRCGQHAVLLGLQEPVLRQQLIAGPLGELLVQRIRNAQGAENLV